MRISTRGVGLPLSTAPFNRFVELKFDEFKYILVSLLVARCSKDIGKGGDDGDDDGDGDDGDGDGLEEREVAAS